MTPAERLRAAAEVLRERANAASQGPWYRDATLVDSDTSRVLTHNVVENLWDVAWVGAGATEPPEREAQAADNADYIALMHPGVALAVADWLEGEANAQSYTPDAQLAAFEVFRTVAPPARLADLILANRPTDQEAS